MGGVLETIIGGLIVAAVTGLTILAYKHPDAYKKLGVVLSAILLFLMVVFMTWKLGYQAGALAVRLEKPTERTLIKPSSMFKELWPGLALLGLAFYLFALLGLPELLQKEKPKTRRHKEPTL